VSVPRNHDPPDDRSCRIIPDRRRRNGSETTSSAKNSANPRQISAGERQQFGATAIPAKPVQDGAARLIEALAESCPEDRAQAVERVLGEQHEHYAAFARGVRSLYGAVEPSQGNAGRPKDSRKKLG
jgi:hypothetical protein